MQITIDTSVALSDTDKAVLALILGDTATTTIVTEPAKGPTPKKAPAKTEPEPEPEEDLIGGEAEEEDEGPTVQDAIDRATYLVNAGRQAAVKAALKVVGADRVSNIPASKAAAFLAAVEG